MNRKKIILGFGGKLDLNELEFVFKLIPHQHVLFVGAVVNELIGTEAFPPCQSGTCKTESCQQKKERKARKAWYQELADQCKKSGSRYIIHKDDGCLSGELFRETNYADLLIINQQAYRSKVKNAEGEIVPFKKMLEQSGCPVLVLPVNTVDVDQVVMTFDGTAKSLNGIKQFAYLLSELGQSLPVTILTTYCEEGPLDLDEKLFIEYLKQHFSSVALHKLSDDSEHTLYSAVGLNANTLMVVNNPSPKNLRILSNVLNSEDSSVPFKLFTQPIHD
jgi:hypothetical protein